MTSTKETELDLRIYSDYIEKSEIYKCSICELEGSEEEITDHLKEIERLGKFPFVEDRKLPTGSLIKVQNNYEDSYSLTNIVGYFYTLHHEICYYISPRVAVRDSDEYSFGEFGEYVYRNEILSCRKIKEKNLILDQKSFES